MLIFAFDPNVHEYMLSWARKNTYVKDSWIQLKLNKVKYTSTRENYIPASLLLKRLQYEWKKHCQVIYILNNLILNRGKPEERESLTIKLNQSKTTINCLSTSCKINNFIMYWQDINIWAISNLNLTIISHIIDILSSDNYFRTESLNSDGQQFHQNQETKTEFKQWWSTIPPKSRNQNRV